MKRLADAERIEYLRAENILRGDVSRESIAWLLDAFEAEKAAHAETRSKLEDAESDLADTITVRDYREEQLESIHELSGCEREWSNLHDLGTCAVQSAECAATAVKERDSALAEAARLREALELVVTVWDGRRADGAIDRVIDNARAAIQSGDVGSTVRVRAKGDGTP